MFAFGSGNKLNHFFGAAEPFLDAVGIGAESLCGQSCGYARVGKSGVFSDEANLVDADTRMSAMGENRRPGDRKGLRPWGRIP